MNPNLDLALEGVRAEAGAAALELDVRFTGRIAGIFGPSGSGKTTMIELIAGLRCPVAGRIRIGSQVVVDVAAGIWVAPRHRRVGLVPQDLALFPHLTARGNLLYGSRAAPHDATPVEFDRVVGMLEITGLLDRSVDQLSGGERQRVALGRALLASPRLLLLDEPMASLDWPLKSRLLPCLARVRDELGLPMAYVSHDRREILALADELLVLDHGRVQQQGPVVEVFRRPANAAVAAQVTSETVLPCRVIERGDGLVQLAAGSATLLALDDGLPEPTVDVFACIRAEDVSVVVEPSPRISSRNRLAGVVRGLHAEGATVRVTIDCGFELTALLTRSGCETLALRPGLDVVALIKAPQIHLIPR